MEKLQKHLTELRSRAAALSDKRASAETALAEAMVDREKHMLTGDLADEQTAHKLQAKVDSYQSQWSGIAAALVALQPQITDIEQKIAAEQEGIQRAAAANKLDRQIAAIETALPKYLEHSRVLADALAEIAHWHFESGQMTSFIVGDMGQVEVAAGFALAELKRMPGAIREGQQAIPRDVPQSGLVAEIKPLPPTQTVFMLRSAKYHDHDGRARFAGQYEDAMMPVPTAQRALHHGVAVSVADPRRAQLRGARGGDFNPSASDVVDLDAIEEPKGVPYIGSDIADPVLRAANFQPLDRGPERMLKVTP
ncbi:hypothetical protein [Bradyrhizobium erythrophlei]|nr:hypothetical protein [Bradyrhizobium erythrophlei]